MPRLVVFAGPQKQMAMVSSGGVCLMKVVRQVCRRECSFAFFDIIVVLVVVVVDFAWGMKAEGGYAIMKLRHVREM